MIRIGTAGWSIPTRYADDFPGAGSHLERYSRVFPAAEINSSFHRRHRRSTYERWAASVPPGFRFSAKIPKTISHTARLVGVEDLVDAFVGEIGGLGGTLGVVLLQLPPSFAFDAAAVAPFLAGLRLRIGDATGIACEPRHASWFEPPADACLDAHRVARVAADPVLAPGADRPGGWAGLRYFRLHGTPRVYYSAYEPVRLAELASTLAGPADSWCIFDNTASGAATGDALATHSMTGTST